MNLDEMRAEFERQKPVPEGVEWDGSKYVAFTYLKESGE